MTEKEEKVIKSFKRYINFQESTMDDYYILDDSFYKDEIEQLEFSILLLKKVLELIENQQISLEQKNKELQELKKYDIRNIQIDKDKIISSPSFTRKEVDLMNFGIALRLNADKLFNENEIEENEVI